MVGHNLQPNSADSFLSEEFARLGQVGRGDGYRRRRPRAWRIAVGAATAVAGAVLGTAMQEYVDTPFRMLALVVIAVSASLIAVLIALASFVRDAGLMEERMVNATNSSHSRVLDGLNSLERQVGVQVRCQSVEDLNTRAGPHEDLVIQEISKARHSIMIIDIAAKSGRRPDASVKSQIMRGHFDAIDRKVSDGLTYKRVSQVDDPARGLGDVTDMTFLSHLERTCKLRDMRQCKATLKLTRLQYPYEFIIIDERVIVIQFHEMKDLEPYTWCEVLLSDPSSELTNTFLEMWDDLYEGEHSRALTRREIQGIIDLVGDPAQ